MKQTRREFIETLVATGLGLIAGRVQAEDSNQFVSFFRDTTAAKFIGEEYLGQFPDERSVDHLTGLIASDSTSLNAAIRNDFENSRTVKIHGWILSTTEARICALAAISAST